MRAFMNISCRLLASALFFVTAFPCGAVDLDLPDLPEDDPKLETREQKQAPTAFAGDEPQPVLNWGQGRGKSYWVPAFDILLFDSLLNRVNHHVLKMEDFDVGPKSWEDNLEGEWEYDSDRFDINQIGHPYQGSMYHSFARSAGQGFWTSMAYTIGGSAAWEVFGETTPPSINDQITTSIGGSFLSEPLYRMASLLLESGDGRTPGFWRELGAAFISPSTGFNRLAYGKRFDGVFRSHDPAVYTRIDLGANLASSVDSNVPRRRGTETERETPQSYREGEAVADFTLAYGLPGKPGYRYDRPFDYFHFQFTAVTSNALENVMSRGLLLGTDYALGDAYRGVWGLYGTYDYIAPQIFRVSNSGLALGTTMQWWLTRDVALQGTALAGGGYGSAGTARGGDDNTDYRSGITAHGLVALRLNFGDRVSFDVTTRQYRVTDHVTDDDEGHEEILRADASITWRIYNLHGVTVKYVFSDRDASYPNADGIDQDVGAVSIGYAYLGQTRSGSVDWRPRSEGGP
jgi:hypothetical protein